MPFRHSTGETTSFCATAALDVRVTSRDGWLRIEGGEDGVAQARKVFEQLDEARKRGVVIRRPEFNYASMQPGEMVPQS